MPGSYILMYGARSKEEQQKMFEAESKKVTEIVEQVKKKRELIIEKKYPHLTKIMFNFRLFTEKEEAANHCNTGHLKLVLDTFTDWIIQMKYAVR